MSANEKLWDLIDDNKTCMMVTDGEKGLNARPMHAIPEPENKQIWFYTRVDSGKSRDLEADAEVCLCFGCPKSNDYVSVTGRAALADDRERIAKYWSPFVDAWFPGGKDSADVGMIRVDVQRGEYWDGDSSSILAALKMLTASARDETPDMGENRKVSL